MTDEIEKKPEGKLRQMSDVSRREGQFTDQAKQGDWTQATEGNRTTKHDSATMESVSKEKIAEIKSKDGFQKFEIIDPANPGSATDTGTVIDSIPPKPARVVLPLEWITRKIEIPAPSTKSFLILEMPR